MSDLSLGRLRELLVYDPKTGIFRWRISRGPRSRGSVAGNLRPDGYWRIMIDRKMYYLHRLAWFYITGTLPKYEIDHRDLDHGNNRFLNLRPATHGQNQANQGLAKHNTSGAKGVYWDRARQKWRAEFNHMGRPIFVGRFDAFDDAAAARIAKAKDMIGEFAR